MMRIQVSKLIIQYYPLYEVMQWHIATTMHIQYLMRGIHEKQMRFDLTVGGCGGCGALLTQPIHVIQPCQIPGCSCKLR